MTDLVGYADENGLDIFLTPSEDFGGSKPRLEEFYGRFGFVPNKGQTRDFRSRETMIRRTEGVAKHGSHDQSSHGRKGFKVQGTALSYNAAADRYQGVTQEDIDFWIADQDPTTKYRRISEEGRAVLAERFPNAEISHPQSNRHPAILSEEGMVAETAMYMALDRNATLYPAAAAQIETLDMNGVLEQSSPNLGAVVVGAPTSPMMLLINPGGVIAHPQNKSALAGLGEGKAAQMDAAVTHEFGHVAHFTALSGSSRVPMSNMLDEYKSVAGSSSPIGDRAVAIDRAGKGIGDRTQSPHVSQYARGNRAEMVAEAFTARQRGLSVTESRHSTAEIDDYMDGLESWAATGSGPPMTTGVAKARTKPGASEMVLVDGPDLFSAGIAAAVDELVPVAEHG